MEFPEEELRLERNFDTDERMRHITGPERFIYGSSVQDFPTESRKDPYNYVPEPESKAEAESGPEQSQPQPQPQ